MENEYENLSDEEQLKADNDFMKMKIMLEKDGSFYSGEETVSPEMENLFLKNIIEFEKQFEEHKQTTVYKKIGSPTHFKRQEDIPDNEIDNAWEQLTNYINEYSISLDACSPNITKRELYRFTTEELFKQEIDDIDMPGFVNGFIYDEFHPDHEYDNTQHAVDDCIKMILCKRPVEFLYGFEDEGIQLNNHTGLNELQLKELLNQFKSKFQEIEVQEVDNVTCIIIEDVCTVAGSYHAVLTFDRIPVEVKANWTVQFLLSDGYWGINNVQVEGVEI